MVLGGAVGGLPAWDLAAVLVHGVANLVFQICSLDSIHNLTTDGYKLHFVLFYSILLYT